MRTRRPRAAPLPRSAFAGYRFPPDVIVVAVRWYLRFALSYRDVEELLAERGVKVDHVSIYRWVQRFTPLLAEAARPCRHRPGDRWYADETYVKVAGRWRYVYRAIDQFGQVIDVLVSPQRDAKAARRFFEQAIGTTKVAPVEVVTDRAATYPIVLEELLPAAWHRTDRYANNGVECDHGRLKSRLRPMRGLIALVPVGRRQCHKPLWRCGGQGFQRRPHGLDDQLQPIELAHRRHHTGGIGALPATPHQQPLRPQALQHLVQEPFGLVVGEQPRAELA